MRYLSTKLITSFLFSLAFLDFSNVSYGNNQLSADDILFKTNNYYIQEDYEQAMQWYLKATNKGVVSAFYSIGGMYYDGRGVNQDYQQAMQWFLKAADLGHVKATYNIGVMYYVGKGVLQDIQDSLKAKEWFQKAADLGDERAKETISIFCQ